MMSGGLRMVLRPIQEGSQFHNAAAGIPASLVILLGMAICVCGWFPSVPAVWWSLFLGMLAFSAVLWLLQMTGKGKWICLILLVLTLAFCAVFHSRVLEGIGCLGNDLLDRMTQRTGQILLDFAAADPASVLWGLLPVLAVCVLLLQLCLQTGSLLFVLPLLAVIYGAVLTGFFPVDAGVFLIGFGSILLVMRSACASARGQGFRGVPSWLTAVLVCVAAAAAMGLCVGELPAQTENWDSALHSALYDQATNSMPEGDLQDLPQWNKSDTPALRITMSQPQKLYLRGQVYETYEGNAWSAASTEEQAAFESLFYWLHQSGFFGQSQIGTASMLTTQAEPETLSVENLSACGAHGYYPYALCGSDTLDADRIGDGQFPAADTLKYYPGSVPEWYAVQYALSSAQGRANVSSYLSAEDGYEAYVTEMDLQLTNESWSVLNRQLGETETPQTLSQILKTIRAFLDEALVYDEEVKTLNGSGDFLQYTLERSGSGYSVHYATAAVLMLRYYGVPARYVEGYFLSAEEAATYSPGQPITLTEEHAHAWAEYYLPGVGFVPFEVTPGYMDDEELALGGALSENEQTYTQDHLKYAQVEQPEHIEEPEQNRFAFSMKPIYWLYLLLLLLAVLGGIVACRRRRLKRSLTAIDQASNREAIAMRFGYARRLLDSCPEADTQDSRWAEEQNREALFSNHEMTARQRREMDAYAARVLAACKKKWTVLEKLRYWLWDCLY